MFKQIILPRLIFLVYRLWTLTWRVRVDETPEIKRILAAKEPLIFSHWHRDELSIVHLVKRYRIATMTSSSKDGQLIAYVIKKFGGATSQGSSTRGAVGALKGLTRLVLDEGYRASMAVDGPKGPIFKVKAGVFELSHLADAWIFPVGVASSSHWVFHKAWNKARLPKPFSKVIVSFGALSKMGTGDPRDPHLSQQLALEIEGACKASELKLHGVEGPPTV
jgi:lysophospholipid acyltransferase (LPLAT)-like uncharacterized protein